MDTDNLFEKEVRRIARLLWPSAEGAGALMLSGFEHDGIFETEECIHLVESTISRQKDKALYDSKKMVAAAEKMRKQKPEKAVKCWFITKDEPTADQRTVCHSYRGLVSPLSIQQFQAKLINVSDYLDMRRKHRFGSAYDPQTESFTENLPYVEIDLPQKGTDKLWNVREIAEQLVAGGRFILLGDYGVGKSMTLREVFFRLAMLYQKSKMTQFPVYINLREHHGQTDPAEILERHGRSIGVAQPSHLVRAWRAGYAILLIDGFDEVSSLGLPGGWKRLREARFSSMEGVRRLIRDTSGSSGIAIAGRNSFFDSDDERAEALGTARFTEILLSEFNEEQIKRFLASLGYAGDVPAWMPSRPLLLGTLFSKGVRSKLGDNSLQEIIACSDAAIGWNILLDELCNREAKIEAGLPGSTIRTILETLATRARAKSGGLGPLTKKEIVESFFDICGYEPTDQALSVLQRLPGMGRDPSTGGVSRIFIDSDLADACRGGDVFRFIMDPYHFPQTKSLCEAQVLVQDTGTGIVGFRLLNNERRDGLIKTALIAGKRYLHNGFLLADLVSLSRWLGLPVSEPVCIKEVAYPCLELSGQTLDLAQVTMEKCYIELLEIDAQGEGDLLPCFSGCLIHELDGRISIKDLPSSKFLECEIEVFSHGASTGRAIGDLPLPDGTKVLLSIIKKLFVQSLSGRQESALYRGLDVHRQRYVPKILELLRQQNVITKSGRTGNAVWLPVRRQRTRVLKIVEAPSSSHDLLVEQASII
jgi:hypothetical protein